MILQNEFTVGANLDAVWRELLDIESVATCLPGATVAATDEENVYEGSMRLKLGPMRVEYRGSARLSEVDEQSRTAVISLSAREAKGQGSAMATIRNRLEAADGGAGGTRVIAETELHITGPQAQFGRGVIEDVGKRVLGEFSRCLEQRIGGAPSAGEAPGAPGTSASAGEAPGAPGTSASAGEAPGALGTSASGVPAADPVPHRAAAELDVGSLVARTPAVRAGAAVALLVAVVMILLRRRR